MSFISKSVLHRTHVGVRLLLIYIYHPFFSLFSSSLYRPSPPSITVRCDFVVWLVRSLFLKLVQHLADVSQHLQNSLSLSFKKCFGYGGWFCATSKPSNMICSGPRRCFPPQSSTCLYKHQPKHDMTLGFP
jgi:hypothetical protein